jgi:cell division protein FtsB
MSTSENSNGNKTYNVHLSQQKIKDLNKDFIINKLKKELATLSKELIKLRTENAELRSRVSLINSYEANYKIAKETINEIRDQTNKIISKKDDEQRKLKLQIEQMEHEKTIEELKNNRNMTLYNQKMSVVHHIEMENNVYRDEVKDLKEKNEKLRLATKEKLESLDIINQLKFSQFKRKMIDSLKEAKNNVSKLNLEYMDLNGKITVLQNHQLLSEIEFQKEQIDNLDKENSILKKKIFDLEKDLAIHKKVEIKLALKAKNNRNNDNEINLKTENLSEKNCKNEDIILNNSNGVTLLPINDSNNFKLINGKNIINKEKINDILNNNENKNNKIVSKSSTSYNKRFSCS